MKEDKCSFCGNKIIVTFCVGYDYDYTDDGEIICMGCAEIESDTGEIH